jgi:hypothetical protein
MPQPPLCIFRIRVADLFGDRAVRLGDEDPAAMSLHSGLDGCDNGLDMSRVEGLVGRVVGGVEGG